MNIMNVTDITYTHNGPYGPLHEDNLLIDGEEWATVSDFVASGKGTLQRGMLYKICQNLPLQRLFREKSFQLIGVTDPDMLDCLEYLKEQFRPFSESELSQILPRLRGQTDEVRNKQIDFFHSCQPFLGKDKAVFISTIYANKQVNGCMYDPPIESLLRSFLA